MIKIEEPYVISCNPEDIDSNTARCYKIGQYDIFSIDKILFDFADGLTPQGITKMINTHEIIYGTSSEQGRLIITGVQPNKTFLIRIFKEGTWEENRDYYTCLVAREKDTDIVDVEKQNRIISQYGNLVTMW